jgi:hypothetical protein
MLRMASIIALASSSLISAIAFAVAQQSGTAADAKAMLDRAVAALKANETAAIAAFNDKSNNQYHDRDLYVFCLQLNDGIITANSNLVTIGKDGRTLKAGNDPLGQRIFDAIKNAPEGTISTLDYKFPKPGTTKPVSKESYLTRIGNEGCGVGYYK